ncbi:MAG: nucleotidyltransferase family protein [Fibrobacterota bacterium]
MNTVTEIRTKLVKLKEEMHHVFGVSRIEIFGSYVRGEQRENSDVDVLVEFDRDVSFLDVAGLQVFLSEQLGIKVDVVLKRSVRWELKEAIFSEAVQV